MDLKKLIFHNTLISLSSKLVSVIVGIVSINLLTRYLGQSGFGDYSTILAFLFVFSIFTDLGLYSITIREIAKANAEEERLIINNVFTLRIFSGLIIFGLAAFSSLFFPYSSQIKIGILIATLGFWSLAAIQILMCVFQKYLKMEKVALAECLSRVVQLFLLLYFVYKNAGFFSIIWAFSLSSLINLILLFIYAKKYVNFSLNFDFNSWKKILAQSYPLALGAVLTMFYFKFDTVLLSLMKSSVEVGIYSLPYRILEILIFFPSIFTGLIMPPMAKHIFSEPHRFKNIIQKSMDVLLMAAVPLVIGTILLSQKIIIFLSSIDFVKSVDVLNILIFATAIIFISQLFYNIIVVLEKQKDFIRIFAIGAVFNIVSNLIFIPKYSYYATSFNTVLTELLVIYLMAMVIIKNLHYLPSFKMLYKFILAAAVMGVVVYSLSNQFLIIPVIAGAIVYVICLYLLHAISEEDIALIFNKNKFI